MSRRTYCGGRAVLREHVSILAAISQSYTWNSADPAFGTRHAVPPTEVVERRTHRRRALLDRGSLRSPPAARMLRAIGFQLLEPGSFVFIIMLARLHAHQRFGIAHA